jgi:hypothetical protein
MDNGFHDIMMAWKEDTSHSDIFSMIVEWVTTYKDHINPPELVLDLLNRIKSFESEIVIVEDFIYGERYEALRDWMETIH